MGPNETDGKTDPSSIDSNNPSKNAQSTLSVPQPSGKSTTPSVSPNVSVIDQSDIEISDSDNDDDDNDGGKDGDKSGNEQSELIKNDKINDDNQPVATDQSVKDNVSDTPILSGDGNNGVIGDAAKSPTPNITDNAEPDSGHEAMGRNGVIEPNEPTESPINGDEMKVKYDALMKQKSEGIFHIVYYSITSLWNNNQ